MPALASARSLFGLATRFAAAGAACLALLSSAGAATPFNSATITKVENKVRYGERQGDRSNTRLASVSDTVRANNFLRSETDSRAELQYPDGSVVRIGQNSVFTFDAQSRTLSLEKGSMIFHIPKGSGGGTIKTASLTAAITGTAGKLTTDMIMIVSGTVRLQNNQLVHAFEYAVPNGKGGFTVEKFKPEIANDGVLPTFNGLMPGFPEVVTPVAAVILPPTLDLRAMEVFTRTQILPGSVQQFLTTPQPFNPTPKPDELRPRDDNPSTQVRPPPTRRTPPSPSAAPTRSPSP